MKTKLSKLVETLSTSMNVKSDKEILFLDNIFHIVQNDTSYELSTFPFDVLKSFAEKILNYRNSYLEILKKADEIITCSEKTDVSPKELEKLLEQSQKLEKDFSDKYPNFNKDSYINMLKDSVKEFGKFVSEKEDVNEIEKKLEEISVKETKIIEEAEESTVETVVSLTTNPNVSSLAKQLSEIDFGYIDVQEKKAEISKQIKMNQEELQILDVQYIETAKNILKLHHEYKELG